MIEVKQIADFTIKWVMVVMTIVTIIYFAILYNSFVFSSLGILFLLAITVKNAIDIFGGDK